MTDATDIGALLGALRDLAAAPGLPTRASAAARALVDRFERPVRVTVLGLPGAGHSHLANALAGERVIGTDIHWPTTELCHGPAPAFSATLSDGTTVRGKGRPALATLPGPAAFLQVAAPLRPLLDMTVLAVMAAGSARDFHAALDWAARRTDIAIWCSTDWLPDEARLWEEAPAPLRNHAFLAMTAPGGALPPTGDTFEAAFALGLEGGLDRLFAALWQVIEEARAEDTDAARLVLTQYGRQVPARAPVPGAEVIPLTRPTRHEPAIPDEARAALARGFGYLRRQARGMLAALQDGDGDHDLFLRDIEAAIGRLSEMLAAEDTVEETWPHLTAALDEAAELALLLRYEGGAAQAADAAALLLQLRRDMEGELAA